MLFHKKLKSTELLRQLRIKAITLAGNRKLKIYGTLHCVSGRRMKKENRVFFESEAQALQLGFRPCGHCLKKAYADWKTKMIASKSIQL